MRKSCPKRNKKDKNENVEVSKNQDQDIDQHRENFREGSGHIAEEANLVDSHESWIVDTGATSHMTYDESDFEIYKQLEEPRVIRFDGKEKGSGIGVGTVRIISVVEGQRISVRLHNVLHVPQLIRRLISVSTATDKDKYGSGPIYGDKMIFKNAKSELQFIAKKVNGLYVLDVYKGDTAANIEIENMLTLWHERYGHINKKYLVNTSEAVAGLGKLTLDKPSKAGDVIV